MTTHNHHRPTRFTATILALLAALLALPALAGDVVTLKDGRVFEGEIVKEESGYIWIKRTIGGIETTDFISPDDVESVERAAKATPDPEPVRQARAATPRDTPAPRATGRGGPRAAVLTLGEGGGKDMVGMYMTAEQIRNSIPLLKREEIDIVVLKINSGGGALLEIQRISDVIHEELKPEFRVVAWIESAISAAAMSAHCIEEIYFMPEGNYGACTGWFGNLEAVEGRDLEEVLYQMERISARGRYDIDIMRSMQINSGLSATKRDDGTWEFFRGEDGEDLICEIEEILTFNSYTAEKYGFSKGTVETLDELAQAMGLTEVEWVGERDNRFIYPVSQTERENMKWRERVNQDERRTGEYFQAYQLAIGAARGSADRQQRGGFVSRARRHLNSIERMVRNNPNLALFQLNMMPEQFDVWLEEREEELRDLMRAGNG